jgi:hypothetical protein
MPKHNYSQYSNNNNKKNNNKTNITEEFVSYKDSELLANEPVNAVDVVVTPVVEPAPEVKMESNKRKGTVANCAKLNVRVKPDIQADVVCVLAADTEVEIDDRKSNTEWLHVCTVNGVNGYCMRKFVVVRR